MKNTLRNFGFILLGAVLATAGPYTYAGIDGKSGAGNVHNEANRVVAAMIKKQYESHEFLLSAGQTDFDFKVQQSAFSSTKVPRAHFIIIRTDADVSFKLNSISDDSITLTAGEGQFIFSAQEVTNIFFTNTPAANLKIILS